MNATALFLIVLLVLVPLFMYGRGPLLAWRRYRGVRLVTCPETRKPAAVSVDMGHAALTALIDDRVELRLASCSRWAERERCRQPCLAEVQTSGPDGTVRAMAERWYTARTCAGCGRAIAKAGSTHHEPALLGPDGVTVEWSDIQPEQLPEMFATHKPVCWNCHMAASFIRSHPEIVAGRQRLR